MVVVHLGLGTNLGDRAAMLRRAIDELARHLTITRVSSVYETAPWGLGGQPPFLNCCVRAETALTPRALLSLVKTIETRLGRTSTVRWGPREIDVDVLLYGEQRIAEEDLVVPHPRLLERAFALVPLAEVSPEARIPGVDLTARDALARVRREPGDVRAVGEPAGVSPHTAR